VKLLGNRGFQELRVRHLPITETQANVDAIADLARREFQDESIQIVGKDGLFYEDMEGTRGGYSSVYRVRQSSLKIALSWL
jgi:hypothetical protein